MAIDPNKQLPGGPDTVNERYFDALVRHQIGLLRLSGSIRKEIHRILDATEGDIADKIRRVLIRNRGLTRPSDVARLKILLKSIKATRLKALKEVTATWVRELRELSMAEPAFIDGALKTVSPVTLSTVLPAPSFLASLAATKPFEGKVLREWASNFTRTDLRRIEDQIKIGLVQGESSAAIARRVVGTRAFRGRDGILEISRREATAITRTAIIAISNQAKRAFYVANAELFTKELYVATLDSRTTPICRSLDGKTFPVGEGPIPPLHFQCRSLRIAVIDGEVIGSRPARAFTQQQLLREFAAKQGIRPVTSRAALPRGTRGLFDEFSRTRMRVLTGTVPAKVTYQVWLGRQTKAFQVDTLGPTRARLFRSGKLKLDRFVNRQGDEIPLARLARIEREAFISAGLDPENFL